MSWEESHVPLQNGGAAVHRTVGLRNWETFPRGVAEQCACMSMLAFVLAHSCFSIYLPSRFLSPSLPLLTPPAPPSTVCLCRPSTAAAACTPGRALWCVGLGVRAVPRVTWDQDGWGQGPGFRAVPRGAWVQLPCSVVPAQLRLLARTSKVPTMVGTEPI